MTRKKHRRHPLRPVAALLLAVLGSTLFFRRENTALQIDVFRRSFADLPHGFDGCRIAVISDLHGAEFGEDNRELFAALAAEELSHKAHKEELALHS